MDDNLISSINNQTATDSKHLFDLGEDFFCTSGNVVHLCCDVWRAKLQEAGLKVPCARDFAITISRHVVSPDFEGISKLRFKNKNRNLMKTLKFNTSIVRSEEVLKELLKLGSARADGVPHFDKEIVPSNSAVPTIVQLYLPTGEVLKNSMDRIYVCCALREFLGQLSEEEMLKLKRITVKEENEYCPDCNVRVEIICVEDSEEKSIYCIACRPDSVLSRLVDDNWVFIAFRFMNAMNPDKFVPNLKLGASRPHVQGPYFYGLDSIKLKKSWIESDMETMLGNDSKKLFNGYKKEYIKFTTDKLDINAPILNVIKNMRMNDWGMDVLDDLIDVYGSTLILIGDVASMTDFHLDWGSARNWAIRLGSNKGKDAKDPIAVWYLVHPRKVKEFIEKKEKMNLKEGSISASHDELIQIQENIGYDEMGLPYMEVIYQHSGDLIFIPVGWAHGVINLKPCLKVAWDYLEPSELCLNVKNWRELASPYFKSGQDYLPIQAILRLLIERYGSW